MQNDKQTAYLVRIVVYLSQALLTNNIGVKKYVDFNAVINLSVLNYNEFDDDKCVHHLGVCDLETGKFYADIMNIYAFEVKKASENDISHPLTAWGKFFASKTKEECMEAGRLDPYVAEAAEIVTDLNLDKKTRILAEEEELRKLDFNDKLEYAKQQGREEGLETGREEGKEEGRKEGRRDEKIEIATAMIENNLPLDQIVLCTKLSKAEIYKLKSEMSIY